jgi:hypothetical protein
MAFSYTGSALNALVDGLTNNAGPVVTLFNDVKAILNNGITGTDHLSASANIAGTQLSSTAGIKQGQIGGSGAAKSNIVTTESRTNTAYGTLTTPDQIASVVLPTDGLICVAYQATWQESVSGAARAAIFIGANQLQKADLPAPAITQALTNGGNAGVDHSLASHSMGLASSGGATAYTGDVTTGQVLGPDSRTGSSYEGPATSIQAVGPGTGGPCYVFAAAGTYTISVQFKSTSGSVTVKNRKLWAWTLGF